MLRIRDIIKYSSFRFTNTGECIIRNKIAIPALIVVLAVLLAPACSGQDAAETERSIRPAREVISETDALIYEGFLSCAFDEKTCLAEAALILSRVLYPGISVCLYLEQISEMEKELRAMLGKNTEPSAVIKIINDYLFTEKRFKYDKDVHFLNEVLDKRRGSCIGLSTLYIILTGRLDLPVYPVNVPRHVFVRFSDGEIRINIELMNSGEHIPDEQYIKNLRIGDKAVRGGIYLNNLTIKEFYALILNNRGNLRRLNGEFEDAEKDFTLAISLYPEFVDAYYSRGLTNAETGKYDKGIKDCTKALNLDPDCFYAYMNRGIAHHRKGEYAKALADYNRAISLAPETAAFYHNRGNLYKDIGDIEKALGDYNRAIALDKRMQPVYSSRGNLFRECGEFELAMQDYNTALRLDPEFAGIYYFNCGLINMALGNPDGAIEFLSKAVEFDPNHAAAYYNRGMMRAMKGNYVKAVSDCDTAVSLTPESGYAYLVRAMVHGLMKDRDKAFADLKEAIRLEPDLKHMSVLLEVFEDWWTDEDFRKIFE